MYSELVAYFFTRLFADHEQEKHKLSAERKHNFQLYVCLIWKVLKTEKLQCYKACTSLQNKFCH